MSALRAASQEVHQNQNGDRHAQQPRQDVADLAVLTFQGIAGSFTHGAPELLGTTGQCGYLNRSRSDIAKGGCHIGASIPRRSVSDTSDRRDFNAQLTDL